MAGIEDAVEVAGVGGKLGLLARRGLEPARLEPQRERHIEPGQIQPAQHLRALQPDAVRIDLIPQLKAAAAKQGSIDAAASAALGAIENAPIPERVQKLGLKYVAHGILLQEWCGHFPPRPAQHRLTSNSSEPDG